MTIHSKKHRHHHRSKHHKHRAKSARRRLNLSQTELAQTAQATGRGLFSLFGGGDDPKKEIDKLEKDIAKLQKAANMNLSKKKRLVNRAKRNLLMTIMAMNQMESNFKAQFEAMQQKLNIMKNENPEDFSRR